ncbi:MAG: aminoglycoside phosphotransferase family protein, partial [Candidatus Kerfeldbacteria bacterium]|nr:aminoglycoside phosphotransferase family protein [Candidatus Kerfeldbacteria bacterium]
MAIQRQLSLTLKNGRLAALSRPFMFRYFARKLRRWYPGASLVELTIKDTSTTAFKKSIAYTLTLLHTNGRRDAHVLRGNIPSADTTIEARVASAAMKSIWSSQDPAICFSVPRPFGFDEQLRMLMYESSPGAPLARRIARRLPTARNEIGKAAAWLAHLHKKKIQSGRPRSLRRERKEAWYFGMNYRRYYPACDAETRRLFSIFFKKRASLDGEIRKSSFLIHGDYNPTNVLVDRREKKIRIIDFGNAWRYDPMSDYANALVQIEITGWQYGLQRRYVDSLVRTFSRSYEKGNALRGSMINRKRLFLAWWSLQTLSYVLSLDFVTNKTP